jgi:hypothetical protein
MLRAPLAALMVIAGALALAGSARADPRFDPSFELVFTRQDPQAPTGLTVQFNLEQGMQFSAAVFYISRDWGVAQGEAIPVGTRVGGLEATETFGFINGACNTPIPIEAELFNASLDSTNQVSFDDLESEEGLDPSTEGFGTRDFAEDKDANGLLDAIDHYPDFLSAAFGDVLPLIRMAGVTYVGGVPILLQFLIFAPGTRLNLPDPALTQLIAEDPQSGYPMLVVIQDFHDPDGPHNPSPITDYCAPRETAISFFAPDGGPPLFVNPQAGSYGFTLVGLSKRDADNDGIENSLDSCPLVASTGDPTVLNDGDADSDGLDAACDPNDELLTADIDEDGYLNRHDNCPLVPNGQTIVSHGILIDSSTTQTDQDFDDIGHVCDPNPESPDGEVIVSVLTGEVIIGEGSGSGGPPNAAACPHCYRPGGSLAETDEGTGNTLAVAAGLIGVGAGAALVVVGGGTLYMLRRRRN